MEGELTLKNETYMPLRDLVLETMREAILTGRLTSGERLMEIKLARQMGVSRTPVREAIRRLEEEGLVHMEPRRGAVVAGISEKGLRDVLEVRRSLEVLAVCLACERMDAEGQARLLAAQIEMAKAISEKAELTAIAAADEGFHDVIYASTDNDRLVKMLGNIREQIYRFRMEFLKDEARYGMLISEHEDIISAIRGKDCEAAKKAILAHIDTQERTVREGIV